MGNFKCRLTATIADTLKLDAMGRVLQANLRGGSVQRASYNALGAVVVSDDGAYSSRQEEFIVDGLGNRKQAKRVNSRANAHSDYNRIRLNTYDSNGRLTATIDSASIPANTNEYSLSRSVTYDNAGNVRYRLETEYDSQLGNYWGSDYVASF